MIDLDILQRADSVALLHRRLPAIGDEQADWLGELLGDLPLALEQAAAYLRTTGLPIDDYLAMLHTRLGDLADRGSVAGRRETLATLWNLSYQRLADEQPAAMQLLQLCAWLAPGEHPPRPLHCSPRSAARTPAAGGDRSPHLGRRRRRSRRLLAGPAHRTPPHLAERALTIWEAR
jgi:hypothetical protein